MRGMMRMMRNGWLPVLLGTLVVAGCDGRPAPGSGEGVAGATEQPREPNEPALPLGPAPVEPPGGPEPGGPEPVPPDPGPVGQAVGALCDFQQALKPYSMRLNPSSEVCDSRLCLYTGIELARCTDFCAEDGDCPGPTADCPSGFVCVARFVVGPPACCKLCICRSALHPVERRDLYSCIGRTCDFTVTED